MRAGTVSRNAGIHLSTGSIIQRGQECHFQNLGKKKKRDIKKKKKKKKKKWFFVYLMIMY